MAWRRQGDKTLSERMIVSLMTSLMIYASLGLNDPYFPDLCFVRYYEIPINLPSVRLNDKIYSHKYHI